MWSWKLRRKRPDPPAADPGVDVPRVIVRTGLGHSAGGGSRLGGISRSHGLDFTDLILPVIVIGGAVAFMNRGCNWHAGSPGLPASPGPSLVLHAPAVPSIGKLSSRPGVKAQGGAERAPTVQVVLDVEVNSDGTPGDIRVVRGVGGTADQRAIDVAKSWHFDPPQAAAPSHQQVVVEVALR